jgi:ATP-dependent helicase/nuclease subunit A
LLELYELVGDFNARQLLDAFIDKRAEWWAATQHDARTVKRSIRRRHCCGWNALCGDDARAMRAVVVGRACAGALAPARRYPAGAGRCANKTRAVAIESALTAEPALENFDALYSQFFDDKDKPRKNGKVKTPLAALVQHFGGRGAALEAFEAEFNAIGDDCGSCRDAARKRLVMQLNAAVFTAGRAYLECYQR